MSLSFAARVLKQAILEDIICDPQHLLGLTKMYQ